MTNPCSKLIIYGIASMLLDRKIEEYEAERAELMRGLPTLSETCQIVRKIQTLEQAKKICDNRFYASADIFVGGADRGKY